MSVRIDPLADVSPEAALLFAAASVRERDANEIRCLSRAVQDWDHVVQAALKNRVVPLVYETLRVIDFDCVPSSAREDFDYWFRRFQLANLNFVRELVELLTEFRRAGLVASPYKGPFLAKELYGDFGRREFYDLDILVRHGDLDAACEIARKRGFVSEGEADPQERKRLIENDCELIFLRDSDRVLLEIHWDVLPARHRRGFEIGPYWERLVPAELAGIPVNVLGPEDLLILLCIHGGEKHRWMRLQMLADIARVFTVHTELDWDLVLERARALDRERTVLLGAYLAWVLLDAPLPREILALASTPAIRAETALTVGRVMRLDSGLSTRAQWRRALAATDRAARDRGHDPGTHLGFMRYVVAILTPEWTDRQALELPSSLSFLYYAYRPYRLLRKHGRALARRV